MSVWGDVFDGLNSMSLTQLLLAFIAATGYMLAQGELAPRRARRIAAVAAVGAAALFVALGDGWERNTMLVVLAVGGIGGFVAMAWMSARLLGFDREPAGWNESAVADLGAAATSASVPARPGAQLASAPVSANGPTAVG